MSATSQPTLSLIVLAWNNLELTRSCVMSLRSHTDVSYELIVVDNASTDGGAEYASDGADIAVLNRENLGFAAGMNRGLEKANGRFVVFINNDTAFPDGWGGRILETLEAHSNVGIVAPAVTAAGNQVTVRSSPGTAVEKLTPFGEFPSGVVFALRTDLAIALGGWNEEYQVASSEDLDLAFTVWAHDLDIIIDERVLVQHVGQASVRHLDGRKDLYRQNLEQFLNRWGSVPLGDQPLWPSVSPKNLVQNQETAALAVIWIRRMLDARMSSSKATPKESPSDGVARNAP